MPQKSIRMSSRDPVWMSPLVKCMLRTKSRISLKNKERLSLFNKRISEVITENRRKSAVIGSGDWWRGVDTLSQRRRSSSINLENNFLVRLNDYFANLCYDDSYVRPIDMDIPDSVKPPEISERCVWNSLVDVKKTATGPDITSRIGSGKTVLSYSHLSLLTFGICHCLLILGRTLGRGQMLTLSPK